MVYKLLFERVDMDVIDLGMVAYVEKLWEEGEGKTVAEYCYASVLRFAPKLKGRLPCALRILNGWRKLELPARASPYSEYDVCVVRNIRQLGAFLRGPLPSGRVRPLPADR